MTAPPSSEVKTVGDALVREYLKKHGFKKAMTLFEVEAPRDETSLKNSSEIVKRLRIVKEYKANKASGSPKKSVLDIVAALAWDTSRASANGSTKGTRQSSKENHEGKDGEEEDDLTSAAMSFYKNKNPAVAKKTVSASGWTLKKGTGEGSRRAVISTASDGTIKSKEWSYFHFDESRSIKPVLGGFGHVKTPGQPRCSFNRMPIAALPGSKGNIEMNSSNVAKYKVGLEVAGKTPSGEKCWVVRVQGSSPDGRSGPGVIELWVPGNDDPGEDDDEEENDEPMLYHTNSSNSSSSSNSVGSNNSSNYSSPSNSNKGAGFSSGGGAGFSSGSESTDDLLAEAEALMCM
jgi:hypothetical protein